MTSVLSLSTANADAFIDAAQWLQGSLLGTIATTLAILAVASIGFLMLTGRIDTRRASQIILGCFIIFGASTIAHGIIGAITGAGQGSELAQATPPPPPLPAAPSLPQAKTKPYDPYAGAALSAR